MIFPITSFFKCSDLLEKLFDVMMGFSELDTLVHDEILGAIVL